MQVFMVRSPSENRLDIYRTIFTEKEALNDPASSKRVEIEENTMISAVVPAAGPCTRMGRFKPLLPIGPLPMIRHVIAGLKQVGVNGIIIAAGHRQKDLFKELTDADVHLVVNHNFNKGVHTSISCGIRHLNAQCCAFFLWPADIPIVRPHTLIQLIHAHTKSPASIIRPLFMGEYGYPLLLPFQSAEYVKGWKEDEGFQQFLAQSSISICNVAVADRRILLDVNTPKDYREALVCWSRNDVPTAEECEEILTAVYPVEKRVLRHCRKVAEVAGRIGQALFEKGITLDLEAICAGGLLHDIGKGSKDHALVGQQMLFKMDYPRIGEIVGGHTDLQVDDTSRITEVEVVHLADKLVERDKIIGIKKRFEPPLRKWAHDPLAMGHVKRRLAVAVILQNKIEGALHQPIRDLFHF